MKEIMKTIEAVLDCIDKDIAMANKFIEMPSNSSVMEKSIAHSQLAIAKSLMAIYAEMISQNMGKKQ